MRRAAAAHAAEPATSHATRPPSPAPAWPRALDAPAEGHAPPLVGHVLRAPGRPLPDAERGFMEARFGRDFSRVRVHDDAPAALSALAVGAEAYTAGGHIVFGPGRFAPHTGAGRALLAHELAHVPEHPTRATPSLRVGDTHDPAEARAERQAQAALARGAHDAAPAGHERGVRGSGGREHRAEELRPGSPWSPLDDAGVLRRRACSMSQALGRGAGYGALAGGIAGALIGALAGSAAGPLGALIGAGIGLLIGAAVGALAGLGIGAATYAGERGERREHQPRAGAITPGARAAGPSHLETTAATGLVDDPAAAQVRVSRTLPAGTRVVVTDDGATAPFNAGGGDWVRVRVTTGPALDAAGWTHRAALADRPETTEITPATALVLFREMAAARFVDDRGTDTPVPFHYPIDGCYFRAHRMSQLLTEKGYASERVFAVTNVDPECANYRLAPESRYAGDREAPRVTWWYHVAPVIRVRVPERGLVEMVLDPSLAGGPITIDEWTRLMNPEPFERLTLDELRARVQESGGRFPADQRLTFVANRDTYNLAGAINPPAPGTAEAAYQRDRATLRTYAQRAEVHELAAALRDRLAGPSVDADAVLATIRAATPHARREFPSDFPNLHAALMGRLSDADRARVRTELARP